MATLAAILISLLGAISSLTTNEITSPPPSNIVHSTLETLQETSKNTKYITTTKAPIQEVSTNLQSIYTTTVSSVHQENGRGTTSNHNTTITITQLKKEASTTYKSVDEVVTTTVLPIQLDNGDISTTSNTTWAMYTVSNTTLATYDTTSIMPLQNDSTMPNQTAAIAPSNGEMPVNVTTTILPMQEDDNKNLTSNYAINTTTSRANESNVTQTNEVKKTKAAWILPTLLIIVALSVVALIIHAKWEDHSNNLRICFRDCLWVQMCSSDSERHPLNGKLSEKMDVGNIEAEGCGGSGIESGCGGGAEGEICNGADKLEGDFTVTFEETKL